MENPWNLVQERICRKCIDGDGRGNCRLPRGESCALQQFLPAIIETVQSIEWAPYETYVSALRASVCAQCKDQDASGVCARRNTLECALDRYFGLVIRVIDEVHAGTFSTIKS
ncbi:MAG: hypothetical protein WEB37_06825 [Bacteroidota bacterium]